MSDCSSDVGPSDLGEAGHRLWSRDFSGASGLFGFTLKGAGDAARARFIDALAHFGLGFSWGGYESLAVPADPQAIRSATAWTDPDAPVRLSIGLEDPADPTADLDRGFADRQSVGGGTRWADWGENGWRRDT